MNLSIIPAAFDCLRKGSALADPKLKLGGMACSAAVGAFALSLGSLAKAAGYDIHIDQGTADALGAVAAWVVGSVFHIATTDKLGVLPAKPVAGPAGVEPASRQGPLDSQPRSEPAQPPAADPLRTGDIPLDPAA